MSKKLWIKRKKKSTYFLPYSLPVPSTFQQKNVWKYKLIQRIIRGHTLKTKDTFELHNFLRWMSIKTTANTGNSSIIVKACENYSFKLFIKHKHIQNISTATKKGTIWLFELRYGFFGDRQRLFCSRNANKNWILRTSFQ